MKAAKSILLGFAFALIALGTLPFLVAHIFADDGIPPAAESGIIAKLFDSDDRNA